MPMKDLNGIRFGRLVVLRRDTERHHLVIVRCDCGIEKAVRAARLTAGKTHSCGCFQVDGVRARSRTHGESWPKPTPEYKAWSAMISRCYHGVGGRTYADYGGRGITVCSEWRESYESFLASVGRRPHGCSLGRIDNDGNYEPGNVRWETISQQSRNKRTNEMVTAFGKTQCVLDWARELGVNLSTIHNRLDDGWNPERAVSEPARKMTRKIK